MFNKIITFLKEWTLPVAIIGGAALYVIFAFVPALDRASRIFTPVIDAIFPLFLFLVLFTTFCRIDFHRMRPVRWHLWVGLIQLLFIVAPVLLILYFELTGKALTMMECLLMTMIAPCASAAPVVTSRLEGDLEQMTTYVFVSNLATAVLIPLVFPLIDPAVDMPFWRSVFAILQRVAVVLLLPMLLAYLVKHLAPRLLRAIVGHPNASFYFWGCSLVIVSGTTVRNIVRSDAAPVFLVAIAVVSLIACLVQFATGRYIGHYTGHAIETGQALGQKNTAFAIWIAGMYLNPLSTVGPGCYILWQNFINSLEIWQHDRKKP